MHVLPAAPAPTSREARALARIAADCAALERAFELRAPASERLDAELGPQLAAFVVEALRGHPARRLGWLAA